MIALITPTGARRDQFLLCQKFMERQTYKGEVVWVIVDDAIPVTTNSIESNFKRDWGLLRIFPKPAWAGKNTQARNLKAGIDYIKLAFKKDDIKAIFIIEDDDYYKPEYLQKMMNRLGRFHIIGETLTIYYNVQWRRYAKNNNRSYASLFQTAFTWDAIPAFEACYNHKFIDGAFWKLVTNRMLFFDNYISIGMKGMPGRGGIGAGHRMGMQMSGDINMNFLQKLIGKDDARFYERYHRDSRQPQHDILTKKRT